mgnify:CR=1 FL=1
MVRVSAALSILALLGSPALAQGPSAQSAPAGQAPGLATEIVGPQGSFKLQPDGVNWERFQTVRSIGVRCTDKACGGERVFCMIQVRGAEDARAGQPTSRESAEEFGAGVVRNSPKEMTAGYVAPFAEKSFGPNLGQWAELKAEGEPGSLRFGLFLAKAEKHMVAFNCVSPGAKWDENKPKFETLIGSLQITR